MDEYIEREALISDIQAAVDNSGMGVMIANALKRYVKRVPCADVAPVRHGQWVEYQIPPIICCSNCDWATGIEEKNFQHCPNCGAKMDG